LSREQTRQSAKWCVGGEEGLDLLHRRAPAEAGKVTDDLDVGEVAGGQRVGVAAAEEAEALNRPRADLTHCPQSAVGAALFGVAATASDLGGDGPQGDRPPQRQPHRLKLGRRPAGDRRWTGHIAQDTAFAAQPRTPTTDDAALDPRRSSRLNQLLDDRPGNGFPGPGRTARPPVRAPAQQRPEQGITAETPVELGEVVVDGERKAHPLDRDLELSIAGWLAERGRAQTWSIDRCGIDRFGPQHYPLGVGVPGTNDDWAILDVQQAGDDAASYPCGAVLAPVGRQAVRKGGCDLCLEPRHRPSRWTSTRKERLATTFCRSRRRKRRRGDRLRLATAPTARTAATVAAPARTPPAAAIAAVFASLRTASGAGLSWGRTRIRTGSRSVLLTQSTVAMRPNGKKGLGG
jgi:hypothetical protein